MFDVLLVVGFIVFIGVLLFFAYQESSAENKEAIFEPIEPIDASKSLADNSEYDRYNELIDSIREKLIISNYDLVTKADDEFFNCHEFWFDLGLGLYVKSSRYSWKSLYFHSNSLPTLTFINVNDLDSYVDILQYEAHINGLGAIIENCEHPKNRHWKLYQEHEFKLKKEREDKMKSWVDSVIVKHQEYNDLSYKYESLPAAPVDSVDGFLNFCKILHENVEYEDYEIQNYLTQKVMEFKKESYK